MRYGAILFLLGAGMTVLMSLTSASESQARDIGSTIFLVALALGALLTVWALREGAFRYRVVIDEEMPIDRDMPRKHFAERAVHAFAGRLEGCIGRHPADWQGWFYLDAIEREA